VGGVSLLRRLLNPLVVGIAVMMLGLVVISGFAPTRATDPASIESFRLVGNLTMGTCSSLDQVTVQGDDGSQVAAARVDVPSGAECRVEFVLFVRAADHYFVRLGNQVRLSLPLERGPGEYEWEGDVHGTIRAEPDE
jgi:hypothetical protein